MPLGICGLREESKYIYGAAVSYCLPAIALPSLAKCLPKVFDRVELLASPAVVRLLPVLESISSRLVVISSDLQIIKNTEEFTSHHVLIKPTTPGKLLETSSKQVKIAEEEPFIQRLSKESGEAGTACSSTFTTV